jgi:hypothetical protein
VKPVTKALRDALRETAGDAGRRFVLRRHYWVLACKEKEEAR